MFSKRVPDFLVARQLSRPMLSALVVAVVLGIAPDGLFPHADTLAQVICVLRGA